MSTIERIDQFERSIVNGSWKTDNKELFGGADVYITDCESDVCEQNQNATYVVSEHAYKLSGVAFQMRTLLNDLLSFENKYIVFRNMADAMNIAIERNMGFTEIALMGIEAMRSTLRIDEGNNEIFFGYGLTMDKAFMAEQCPNAFSIGDAVLHGYRIVLDCAGEVTIEPGSDYDDVYGLLWRVDKSDIATLDSVEGLSSRDHRKERVTVEVHWCGLDAFTYQSMRDTKNSMYEYYYMQRIVQAARNLNLPQSYIVILRSLR